MPQQKLPRELDDGDDDRDMTQRNDHDDEVEKPHDEDDRARVVRDGPGPERPLQGGRSGNQKRSSGRGH